MSKENTIKLIKSFKGQLVIFLLFWSSCQTMSYYLVTKNHRKATNIQKHYAEAEAIVEGLDIYHFTFPDGEKVLVTYATEETKKPALFFSYSTQDNFGAGFTRRNTYLKPADLSFSIDSSLIGTSFKIIYSSTKPDMVMEEGIFISSLSDEHLEKIHKGLKSFAIIWLIILSVLWLILWIIYKINDDQLIPTPEKDIRSFKVKFGLAQEPNEWDEDL